jgi:hypothetical protein
VSIKSVKSKILFDKSGQKKQRKEDALELARLVYDMFKRKQLNNNKTKLENTSINEGRN